jgi:hypothetical protein
MAPSKYKKEFLDTLKTYEDNPISLSNNGKISNTKLATLFKVDKGTIGNWLTPGSGYYEPAFAKYINKLQEKIYCNDIKIGIIERARGYTEHKFTSEIKETGIILPALSKLSLKRLKEYARYELKLKFESNILWAMLEHQIRTTAEEMKKSELIITKHETKNIPADPAAAKMVLPNIQPKGDKENWDLKDDVNVNVTNLADIAAIMSAKNRK